MPPPSADVADRANDQSGSLAEQLPLLLTPTIPSLFFSCPDVVQSNGLVWTQGQKKKTRGRLDVSPGGRPIQLPVRSYLK